MRIGYSFWGFPGPGITYTPDRGRSHRATLIHGLTTAGHDIVFLQPIATWTKPAATWLAATSGTKGCLTSTCCGTRTSSCPPRPRSVPNDGAHAQSLWGQSGG